MNGFRLDDTCAFGKVFSSNIISDDVFSFGMSCSWQIGESMGGRGSQTLSPGY